MDDLGRAKPSYRKVVAALAESEERYRMLVEGVRQYAIFMLNPEGIILTWNRGIQELLGYTREEIVGQSGEIVFSAADRAAGAFKKELAQAKRSGESIKEHLNCHKDGTEVPVHDTATSLLNAKGRLIGFAKVSRRSDLPPNPEAEATDLELAKAMATIQIEVEHRRRLEAKLLTAVEEERQRLGRDLHDELSQRLAAISLMTHTLAKEAKGRSALDRKKIRTIGDMLSEAVGVARNLTRGLHPLTLTKQGLPAALAELAERVPKEVQFSWPSSNRLELDEAVALHVYRIAEEAVANALKHSEATKITIKLQNLSARKVALTIADNGKGFRQGSVLQGMGLQNMKYRVGAISGSLKITTAPHRGTLVKCIFPLRGKHLMERSNRRDK
jgi:PAS domain S-box-containing protein